MLIAPGDFIPDSDNENDEAVFTQFRAPEMELETHGVATSSPIQAEVAAALTRWGIFPSNSRQSTWTVKVILYQHLRNSHGCSPSICSQC
jgi:hypothetical protein